MAGGAMCIVSKEDLHGLTGNLHYRSVTDESRASFKGVFFEKAKLQYNGNNLFFCTEEGIQFSFRSSGVFSAAHGITIPIDDTGHRHVYQLVKFRQDHSMLFRNCAIHVRYDDPGDHSSIPPMRPVSQAGSLHPSPGIHAVSGPTQLNDMLHYDDVTVVVDGSSRVNLINDEDGETLPVGILTLIELPSGVILTVNSQGFLVGHWIFENKNGQLYMVGDPKAFSLKVSSLKAACGDDPVRPDSSLNQHQAGQEPLQVFSLISATFLPQNHLEFPTHHDFLLAQISANGSVQLIDFNGQRTKVPHKAICMSTEGICFVVNAAQSLCTFPALASRHSETFPFSSSAQMSNFTTEKGALASWQVCPPTLIELVYDFEAQKCHRIKKGAAKVTMNWDTGTVDFDWSPTNTSVKNHSTCSQDTGSHVSSMDYPELDSEGLSMNCQTLGYMLTVGDGLLLVVDASYRLVGKLVQTKQDFPLGFLDYTSDHSSTDIQTMSILAFSTGTVHLASDRIQVNCVFGLIVKLDPSHGANTELEHVCIPLDAAGHFLDEYVPPSSRQNSYRIHLTSIQGYEIVVDSRYTILGHDVGEFHRHTAIPLRSAILVDENLRAQSLSGNTNGLSLRKFGGQRNPERFHVCNEGGPVTDKQDLILFIAITCDWIALKFDGRGHWMSDCVVPTAGKASLCRLAPVTLSEPAASPKNHIICFDASGFSIASSASTSKAPAVSRGQHAGIHQAQKRQLSLAILAETGRALFIDTQTGDIVNQGAPDPLLYVRARERAIAFVYDFHRDSVTGSTILDTLAQGQLAIFHDVQVFKANPSNTMWSESYDGLTAVVSETGRFALIHVETGTSVPTTAGVFLIAKDASRFFIGPSQQMLGTTLLYSALLRGIVGLGDCVMMVASESTEFHDRPSHRDLRSPLSQSEMALSTRLFSPLHSCRKALSKHPRPYLTTHFTESLSIPGGGEHAAIPRPPSVALSSLSASSARKAKANPKESLTIPAFYLRPPENAFKVLYDGNLLRSLQGPTLADGATVLIHDYGAVLVLDCSCFLVSILGHALLQFNDGTYFAISKDGSLAALNLSKDQASSGTSPRAIAPLFRKETDTAGPQKVELFREKQDIHTLSTNLHAFQLEANAPKPMTSRFASSPSSKKGADIACYTVIFGDQYEFAFFGSVVTTCSSSQSSIRQRTTPRSWTTPKKNSDKPPAEDQETPYTVVRGSAAVLSSSGTVCFKPAQSTELPFSHLGNVFVSADGTVLCIQENASRLTTGVVRADPWVSRTPSGGGTFQPGNVKISCWDQGQITSYQNVHVVVDPTGRVDAPEWTRTFPCIIETNDRTFIRVGYDGYVVGRTLVYDFVKRTVRMIGGMHQFSSSVQGQSGRSSTFHGCRASALDLCPHLSASVAPSGDATFFVLTHSGLTLFRPQCPTFLTSVDGTRILIDANGQLSGGTSFRANGAITSPTTVIDVDTDAFTVYDLKFNVRSAFSSSHWASRHDNAIQTFKGSAQIYPAQGLILLRDSSGDYVDLKDRVAVIQPHHGCPIICSPDHRSVGQLFTMVETPSGSEAYLLYDRHKTCVSVVGSQCVCELDPQSHQITYEQTVNQQIVVCTVQGKEPLVLGDQMPLNHQVIGLTMMDGTRLLMGSEGLLRARTSPGLPFLNFPPSVQKLSEDCFMSPLRESSATSPFVSEPISRLPSTPSRGVSPRSVGNALAKSLEHLKDSPSSFQFTTSRPRPNTYVDAVISDIKSPLSKLCATSQPRNTRPTTYLDHSGDSPRTKPESPLLQVSKAPPHSIFSAKTSNPSVTRSPFRRVPPRVARHTTGSEPPARPKQDEPPVTKFAKSKPSSPKSGTRLVASASLSGGVQHMRYNAQTKVYTSQLKPTAMQHFSDLEKSETPVHCSPPCPGGYGLGFSQHPKGRDGFSLSGKGGQSRILRPTASMSLCFRGKTPSTPSQIDSPQYPPSPQLHSNFAEEYPPCIDPVVRLLGQQRSSLPSRYHPSSPLPPIQRTHSFSATTQPLDRPVSFQFVSSNESLHVSTQDTKHPSQAVRALTSFSDEDQILMTKLTPEKVPKPEDPKTSSTTTTEKPFMEGLKRFTLFQSRLASKFTSQPRFK